MGIPITDFKCPHCGETIKDVVYVGPPTGKPDKPYRAGTLPPPIEDHEDDR